jgi:hypothetical protein
MGNNTTRQEPEQTNMYPTGKHHPARLIFGSVLLVGARVVALIIGWLDPAQLHRSRRWARDP